MDGAPRASCPKRFMPFGLRWAVATVLIGTISAAAFFCYRELDAYGKAEACLRNDYGFIYDHENEQVPCAAYRVVEDMGGPSRAGRAIARYLKRHADCPFEQKRNAAVILTHCGESAVPALMHMFRDDDIRTRKEALTALMLLRTKAKSAIPQIVPMFDDESYWMGVATFHETVLQAK